MQSNTLQLKHVLPVVLCKVTGTFRCFFTALKMTEVVGRQVRLMRVYLNRERKFYDPTSLAFCFSLFCKHANLEPTIQSARLKLLFHTAQAGERGKGKAPSLPSLAHIHQNPLTWH